MNNSSNKMKRKRHNLGAISDKHVKYEFEDPDVEATMKTMVKEPYVHHVPGLTGGNGYNGVRDFYTKQLVGKMPANTKIKHISRTVGRDQVVDELILSFTHVELPHVVVMKFDANKIAHEHIYWDQASLLAQIGLLDSKQLPITGIEQEKF
jgi:carboxymethylenebutenolidase